MADPYISAQNAFPNYNWASPTNYSPNSSSASFNPLYSLLGNLGGGALGGLFDMFNTKNPAKAAQPYLNQIGPASYNNFSPYMNTGQGAMNQYYNNASQWSTPQGAMNNYDTIMGGYEQSPYAKYLDDQAAQYSSQAAAASGQAGSPSTQLALSNQISQINSRDMQNYINSILGTQQASQGQLGDLSHLGFDATRQYDQDEINAFLELAGLMYSGQANQNNSSNIFGTLGSLAGSAAGFVPYLMA